MNKIQTESSVFDCPLCASSSTEQYWPVVWECPGHLVRRCKDCQVIYIWPQISEAKECEVYANYAEHVARRKGAKTISVEQTYQETLDGTAHRIERIQEYLQPTSRILEVGAGSGNFIGRLVELGMVKPENASAIEANPERRAFLGEKFGIHCVDSLESLTGFNEGYDLISMFHVLEHIRNPISYLEKMVEHLRNGAILFVEVPSSRDPLLSLFKNDSFRDFIFQPIHHYVYNRGALEYICQRVGLEIIRFNYRQHYSLANHLSWLCTGSSACQHYFQEVFA